MGERKDFPTLVVASTLTGVALCHMRGIGPMHECIEWLFGGPVWTHEIVHGPTQDVYVEEGYRQFPDMPRADEAEKDWRAAATKATAAYGETVSVARGNPDQRRESPLDTIRAVAAHAEVIPIVLADGGSTS